MAIPDTRRSNAMKPATIAGIILLVIGVVALVYQGITYTTREQVVDLGPLEVYEEDTETIPLPPIIGIVAIIGGVALIVVGSKR
jgi:uncharacterized membrane protein HdeD (DUF308 family)